ncbi:hypothetical protein EMIT0P253_180032 [Pseudomonas sp. IT-P253]
MKQVEGLIRKGCGKRGQAARDVLGIATEVNQRIGTLVRADGDLHLCIVDGEGEQACGLDGTGLREVDERALEHQQRSAEQQVHSDNDYDESHQEAQHSTKFKGRH